MTGSKAWQTVRAALGLAAPAPLRDLHGAAQPTLEQDLAEAREALRDRHHAAARKIISTARKRHGLSEEVARVFLRQLVNRRRLALADAFIARHLPHATASQVAIDRARIALRRGRYEETDRGLSAAMAGGADTALTRALSEQLATARVIEQCRERYAYRHIAIGGAMYCGSTVLSTVLGSIPGCFNVGESHHLTEKVDARFHAGERHAAIGGGTFDWEGDDPAVLFPCITCGPACTVFDAPFRRSLAAGGVDWYRAIARQAGTRILVSSDKNSYFLLRRDPTASFDLVVLFKSPADAWRSELKNKERLRAADVDRPALTREMDAYLKLWSQNYLTLLREVPTRGRVVVVDWESFTRSPRAHFRRLCELLGLPVVEGVFSRIRLDQHFFGGNPDVRSSEIKDAGRIDIHPSNAKPLAAADAALVAANEDAQLVYRFLRCRYARDFGDLAAELPASSEA